MADSKISALAALTGANTAATDLLVIVDVSDTSMAASGTNKNIQVTELQQAPIAAGTANGVAYLNGSKVLTSGSALTFDGSTLAVTAISSVAPNVAGISAVSARYNGSNHKLGFTIANANGYPALTYNANSKVSVDTMSYDINGFATQLRLDSGQFAFDYAVSGTAGADIPWSRLATLSSTGLSVTGSLTVGTDAGTIDTQTITLRRGSGSGDQYATLVANGNGLSISGSSGLTTVQGVGAFTSSGLSVTGIVTPEADNTRTLGTADLRWSTVYAGTGTINTSDAREKTTVRSLTESEIAASKQLSAEIGAYQWLSAIAAKGDDAREHIGLTVQRAIEIMQANGLDPMRYGFICYDQWDDVFVEHPAIEAVAAVDATFDEDGNELTPAIAAIEGKAAWTEQTRTAGDRYSFRMDELLLFVSRGFSARLAALESA